MTGPAAGLAARGRPKPVESPVTFRGSGLTFARHDLAAPRFVCVRRRRRVHEGVGRLHPARTQRGDRRLLRRRGTTYVLGLGLEALVSIAVGLLLLGEHLSVAQASGIVLILAGLAAIRAG